MAGTRGIHKNAFRSGQDWTKVSMRLEWEKEEGIGQECLWDYP